MTRAREVPRRGISAHERVMPGSSGALDLLTGISRRHYAITGAVAIGLACDFRREPYRWSRVRAKYPVTPAASREGSDVPPGAISTRAGSA